MKAKPASRPAAEAPVWNAFADSGRTQAAAATECAAAMFQGFEEIRKVQEQAAHLAAQRHQAIAGKLKEATGPGDLLALQADLLRFDVEGATRYWQQIAAVAAEMQTRMAACMAQMADSSALLEAASAVDRATGRTDGRA